MTIHPPQSRELTWTKSHCVQASNDPGAPAVKQAEKTVLYCSRAEPNRSPRRKISVAVGTPVARRPPHRSVREGLLHTALTLGC